MSMAKQIEHTGCAPMPGTGQHESYELARRSRSFAFAARFFDPLSKDTIQHLYRYLRYIDDLVDEGLDRAKAKTSLTQLRLCFGSDEAILARCQDKSLIEFIEFCTMHAMPKNLVDDFLAGQLSDLSGRQLKTRHDLVEYSYKVAGTVGLMFVWLVKSSNIATQRRAADLGVAMQLTNIARDIKDDALAGRFYLPEEMVDQETIMRAITSGDTAAIVEVNAALDEILDMASIYYRSADAGISLLPESVRYPVLLASRLYETIGNHIRRHISGADSSGPVSRRISVSLVQKTLIALQAAIDTKRDINQYLLGRARAREAES